MSSINFDNVYLLFLAIPLVVLLTVPFFIAVRKDNANGHNIASGIIHILIAVLVAFTAAGTKIVTVVTETNVYVVADVSYSANRNLDLIDGYISDLSGNLPRNSQMGVVCFGKDYQLTTRLGDRVGSVKNAEVDDSETDIVGALNYAGSLFRDGVIKRIVLITDGRPTDTSDANALKRTVDNLAAMNVRVDAIYIDDNIAVGGEDVAVKEVQLSDVEFTKKAYLNHAEDVRVTIQSSYACESIVTLYRGGEPMGEQATNLTPGINSVTFRLDTTRAGEFEYEVRVHADDDANGLNNSNYFTQEVTDTVEVLLISGNRNDISAIDGAFSGMANIDPYIKSGDDRIRVPRSVEELLKYDEIVISDIDIRNGIESYEVFEESLETAVNTFGKSLVTLGNIGLQDSVGTQSDTLKKLLPVKYGSTSEDKKLYTVVLDVSRSLWAGSKLAYAKRAAINLIDTLDDSDSLAVVIFHGSVSGDSYMSPVIQKADETRVEEVKKTINDFAITQGTLIGNALKITMDFLRPLDYDDKQVMLISDGINFSGETDDPAEIARQMYSYNIVTSVLNIGALDTGAAAASGRLLLQNIARVGRGNYFPSEGFQGSLADMVDVVFGEMAENNQQKVIDGINSRVNIDRRYDTVLNGLNDLSYISGYVNSKAKPSATTVLTTNFSTVGGTYTPVPVYAYWNSGNGKVATFTSSLSGNWTAAWSRNGISEVFFSNMFDNILPAEQADYPFLLSSMEDSGYTQLTLTPASLLEAVNSDATVEIISPDGETQTEALLFNGSTFVSAKFKSSDAGRYNVTVTYNSGGNTYTADSSFTVSYKSEYNSFAPFEASSLHKMIGEHGEVSEDGKLILVNDEKDIGVRTVSLTIPFMIICVSLFVIDIIIRKLKWEDIKSLFTKVNKG